MLGEGIDRFLERAEHLPANEPGVADPLDTVIGTKLQGDEIRHGGPRTVTDGIHLFGGGSKAGLKTSDFHGPPEAKMIPRS